MSQATTNHRGYLSRSQELALAFATGVTIANAYYIHPIIAEVARTFDVSDAQIGIVPALNQVALALGILLLLPLGDRYSNRSLSIGFVALQSLAMLGMAFSDNLVPFTIASTMLGFVTIAPYLFPAFASKRVAPERLGEVTALLTAGTVFGILIARVGAGVVAEHFGWRTVYWIAAGIMIATTLILPRIMQTGTISEKRSTTAYFPLLASVFVIARQHKDVLLSATIQALNFGSFIAVWLALALYLTSPPLNYGVDVVGYLAGIAAVSVFCTPRIGKWADRVGARRARLYMSLIQLFGVALFYPLGSSALLLVIPLALVAAVGPSVDVTGRMLFLSLEPELRTRLTTIYIVIMFIGGGVGSILATSVYDIGGWPATCALVGAASLVIVGLSYWSVRKHSS
ncbi:MFS transporter [Altererythrobacter sp. MF3-039]|uniref:MFS transporter n=1 Tax=Altererythrobacter sp. MF3-039 TaxID=3252901 RepID=UPI00390C9066